MEDFLFISLCELAAIFTLWPRMIEKTNDWSAKQVQRDNPHLRICLYARKWITPSLFVILTALAIFLILDRANGFVEILFLNILVVITALLLGSILSQSVVDRVMIDRKRFY